jgi:hypothetical protein
VKGLLGRSGSGGEGPELVQPFLHSLQKNVAP